MQASAPARGAPTVFLLIVAFGSSLKFKALGLAPAGAASQSSRPQHATTEYERAY
ncbi:hypothetical protein KSZ_67230 [Dictyobacter formicarum]|uniref:Uncharacterized protein n=1 Tax=Dictyobacter formicarum TaxID=2778368 RepID=A0ABQ3VS70_9CHLR|nr:hypothetical protein KSZ_67230 [Dictyobacter formicarum]